MKLLLFIFLILGKSLFSFGTDTTLSANEVKISSYQEKFFFYIDINPKKANRYLDSISILTKKNKDLSFYKNYTKGYSKFLLHQMDSANIYYTKALDNAKKTNRPKQEIDAIIWLANMATFASQKFKAESYYTKALNQSIQLDYPSGIIEGLFGLANMEVNEEKRLEKYISVITYCEENKYSSAVLANTYNQIGEIYWKSLENPEKAIPYYKQAEKISQKHNYYPGVKTASFVLGEIAMAKGEYKKADQIFNDLLAISIKNKQKNAEAHNRLAIATLAAKQDKWEQVKPQLEKAIAFFIVSDNSTTLAYARLSFAEYYLAIDDLENAAKLIEFVAEINFDSFGFLVRKQQINQLYFEKKGEYKKAYQAQKEIESFLYQQNQEKQSETFIAMEQKYNSELKEKEIELLSVKNKIIATEKEADKNRFIQWAIIGLFGLLFLSLFLMNRIRKTKQLKELNQIKTAFFANVSHEFRTPLTLISLPIQRKLDNPEISQEDKNQYQLILKNCENLLQLITQLLDLSKIDAKGEHLSISANHSKDFFTQILESFDFSFRSKKIELTINSSYSIDCFWMDQVKIEKIVLNLLSNALKYTPENGTVTVDINHTETTCFFTIRNSGKGLSKKEVLNIFNRFYQTSESNLGNGIGLSLCKELVELHKGKLSANSEINKWTEFKLEFPIQKSTYKKHEINTQEFIEIENSQAITNNPIITLTKPFNQYDKKSLLIVEDNKELNQQLQDVFKDQFEIYTAYNGQDGIDFALNNLPDLILSDIMMPIKTGIELVEELKADEVTNHIPILLLTGKSGDHNQLKGITSGADDYIAKPFHPEILKAKIAQILKTRQLLSEKYSREFSLTPKKINANSQQDKFLIQLKKITDLHLNDSEFTVDKFAEKMNLSRMQLYRKLKAVSKLTPSEYIRNQRLIQAKDLLHNADLTISEIAHLVGFNIPSYFTKSFKEFYGFTPTEFLKNNK